MVKKKNILYDDEHIVIINKEAGDLTVPDRYNEKLFNLYTFLNNKYGKIYTVHRLDRETSGAIVFAKDAESHRSLSIQFQEREVNKTYNTIVLHRVYVDQDTIEKKILKKPNINQMLISGEGKMAITHFQVQERYRDFTQLQVKIESGRTHQIRVHMQSIGHPIAVDPMYGGKEELYISDIKTRNFNESRETRTQRPLISRVSLHAEKLEFKHPATDELISKTAPFPKDYKALVNQLNKWGK